MGCAVRINAGILPSAALILVLCTTGAEVAAAGKAPLAVKSPPRPQAPVTSQILQNVAASLKMYVDRLLNIPKIYGYRTQKHGPPIPIPLAIGMWAKTWKFHCDFPPTPVFVFGTSAQNVMFPGPTIYARQGTPLQIRWENHLPDKHILPTAKGREESLSDNFDIEMGRKRGITVSTPACFGDGKDIRIEWHFARLTRGIC